MSAARPHLTVALALLAAGGLWLVGGAPQSQAQFYREGAVTTRSVSGQFLVQGRQNPGLRTDVLPLATNRAYIVLDPTLVTVSCERVRQTVLRELGIAPAWQGKINVSLRETFSGNDPVQITSTRFTDGWRYHVEVPELVDRRRYLAGVVHVVLLEIANRTSAERSVEVPDWLREGFTQHLLSSAELEIMLPPPSSLRSDRPSAMFVDVRKEHPLAAAHKLLAAHPALTFEELSWPRPNTFSGFNADLYRASAQVFVHSLLQLRDGRSCLARTLELLPQFYNWQFAFLRAFQGYFNRPLDVEKWWSVQNLQFAGKSLEQTFTLTDTWQKLDETLVVHVQVHSRTNELSAYTGIKLQRVVLDWSQEEQLRTLAVKLREFEILRSRAALPAVDLLDSYRRVLETYYQEQLLGKQRRRLPASKQVIRRIREEVARQLDQLDQRFAGERALPVLTGATSPPRPEP